MSSHATQGHPRQASAGLSDKERMRLDDLMGHLPQRAERALEVGARDGYLSLELLARCRRLVALDLSVPRINHPAIMPLAGDVSALPFKDASFDLVICTEVLEHLPPEHLAPAAAELRRVSAGPVVIGVPFRQDLRLDRARCQGCGRINAPWGHLNSFSRASLQRLMAPMTARRVSLVGSHIERTNWLSARLMDLAGQPWGAYGPEEHCRWCGTVLTAPPRPGPAKRALAKAAVMLDKWQRRFLRPQPIWIHATFTH